MSEKMHSFEEVVRNPKEYMDDDQIELSKKRETDLFEKEIPQDLNMQLQNIASLGIHEQLNISSEDYIKQVKDIISSFEPSKEAHELGFKNYILVEPRIDIKSLVKLLKSEHGKNIFQQSHNTYEISIAENRTSEPSFGTQRVESLEAFPEPYILQINLEYFRDVNFLESGLVDKSNGNIELKNIPITPSANMRCLSMIEGCYLVFSHPESLQKAPESDKNGIDPEDNRYDLIGPAHLFGQTRAVDKNNNERQMPVFAAVTNHFERNFEEGTEENTDNYINVTGLHQQIAAVEGFENTRIPVAIENKK